MSEQSICIARREGYLHALRDVMSFECAYVPVEIDGEPREFIDGEVLAALVLDLRTQMEKNYV